MGTVEGTFEGTVDRFCTRCGQPHDASRDHGSCVTALALEPARFCPQCARRMVVQVTPGGWTARCSQHGELQPQS